MFAEWPAAATFWRESKHVDHLDQEGLCSPSISARLPRGWGLWSQRWRRGTSGAAAACDALARRLAKAGIGNVRVPRRDYGLTALALWRCRDPGPAASLLVSRPSGLLPIWGEWRHVRDCRSFRSVFVWTFTTISRAGFLCLCRDGRR